MVPMSIDTVFIIAPPYALTKQLVNVLFLFLYFFINLNFVFIFCFHKTVLKDDSSDHSKQKIKQKYLHAALFITIWTQYRKCCYWNEVCHPFHENYKWDTFWLKYLWNVNPCQGSLSCGYWKNAEENAQKYVHLSSGLFVLYLIPTINYAIQRKCA